MRFPGCVGVVEVEAAYVPVSRFIMLNKAAAALPSTGPAGLIFMFADQLSS